MDKKQRMIERIDNHAAHLEAIFPNATKKGLDLCRAVRRIEGKAHNAAESLCNADMSLTDVKECNRIIDESETAIRRLLGVGEDFPLFVNTDPRGYALKIHDGYIRDNEINIHRDWGGYGIIAPDLTDD